MVCWHSFGLSQLAHVGHGVQLLHRQLLALSHCSCVLVPVEAHVTFVAGTERVGCLIQRAQLVGERQQPTHPWPRSGRKEGCRKKAREEGRGMGGGRLATSLLMCKTRRHIGQTLRFSFHRPTESCSHCPRNGGQMPLCWVPWRPELYPAPCQCGGKLLEVCVWHRDRESIRSRDRQKAQRASFGSVCSTRGAAC